MVRDDGVRWLLLIHQIPPTPHYLRVKVGRRLQRLGAAAIKNSVYVLPRADQAREDFEWVAREIVKERGEACVCEARFVDGLSDAQVEALFNAAREADYRDVAVRARELLRSGRARTIDEARRAELEAGLARLRRRLGEITAIDFFGAGGSQAAEASLADIAARLRPAEPEPSPSARPAASVAQLQGRIWVTRRGVHVDRIASAWLIRRFVDPGARFHFVSPRDRRPGSGEIRFDMFEAEFTHDGDLCTFEVLLRDLGIADAALAAIAEIVHDIDLKDAKFGRVDTAGVERLIHGIALANHDDHRRLEQGAVVLDALYESLRVRSRDRAPASAR